MMNRSAPAPGPPSAAGQGSSYFQPDSKKGEVNELKTLLRNVGVERDPKRKRDVIKKVIAYMTLGIDVSRLFTEMVMSIETRDLVVKKMVYHYLCTYAHEKPEMGLMCINTLQRDCSNDDPMVRGLALRSLCSLRLPTVLEYIQGPLRASLSDAHSYVRKTGVMGILKVYHMDPESVRGGDLVDVLYDMLRDGDGTVVANCIVVLNEIMLDEGGIAINTAIVHHLLGRLNDFNEWGLCSVLKLVARYEPASDEETFQVMNVLDPVLRTSNSGVVLECIGCFVNLTKHLPELHAQPDYRNFYIRYDEPSPVKHVKVHLLAELASDQSADDVMAELKEYAADVDADLAKAAIRAIGAIAGRLRTKAEAATRALVEFLELDVAYVKAEALLVARDVLRRYPERRGDVLPSLARYLKDLDGSANPAGRAAALFIVGQWGEEITDAPYMLEPLIDAYGSETSVDVKLALLTAATRLFFKRPPEMQNMLRRLLDAALEAASSGARQALFYFRLLRRDVATAQKVVNGRDPCGVVVGAFAEDNCALLDRLVDEGFNTLAVLYGETPDQFIAPNKRAKDDLPKRGAGAPRRRRRRRPTTAAATSSAAAAAAAPARARARGRPPRRPPRRRRRRRPGGARAAGLVEAAGSVSGEDFQAKWARSRRGAGAIPTNGPPQGTDMVDAMLASLHVHTMASGELRTKSSSSSTRATRGARSTSSARRDLVRAARDAVERARRRRASASGASSVRSAKSAAQGASPGSCRGCMATMRLFKTPPET
ncbi:hypothetical protein JL722_10581 [Aureococcus anophagefferens]|nr:hypothetical protein JL722_10581 [Aureococcus anophagefferens]